MVFYETGPYNGGMCIKATGSFFMGITPVGGNFMEAKGRKNNFYVIGFIFRQQSTFTTDKLIADG